MHARLRFAFLCVLVVSAAVWAQKQIAYRTGRLLAVSDETELSSANTAYLLHIQDGADEYFALYSVLHPFFVLRHDKSDWLRPDMDVQYRVLGKSLFVKIADDKEIKAKLCQRVKLSDKIGGASGIKCGGSIFLGKDAESQAPQTPLR